MSKRLSMFFALIACSLLSIMPACAGAGVVEIKENRLNIDGVAQPQLWGAEVQYFRMRGGAGRNVPREKVMELWSKSLDRFQEAGMNAISFYIPWDFHEYAEGKFDFTGTVDEDGDGNPDYPSRDVKTFIRMIEERGIKHIMVRPGPFINAEWGFVGFGAVPLWFHEKFPGSHMKNMKGQYTTLYSYLGPEFLEYGKRWITAVHREVVKDLLGSGRATHFIQLDNETNYMWQSIHNHDYSFQNIVRYREYLKNRYKTIDAVNTAHARKWKSFDDAMPAGKPGENIREDQEWYRFQDKVIHVYLQQVRKWWEDLGVKEPNVLFILAESYNALDHGLLPNYQYRNDPGKTGLMTVNLYPKTYELPKFALHNNAFKTDHDVKAADSANDYYFGSKQEWVMGPEIQGGWWKGINITEDSRRQTYLTVIGHGMKAAYIYYFNEGNNWQGDWAYKRVLPHYNKLHADPRYRDIAMNRLPNEFWTELNGILAEKEFDRWDARHILTNGGTQPANMFFDAPLDLNSNPRPHFRVLKEIGTKIVKPYGEFLAGATEMTDPVCFVKDSAQHAPSTVTWITSRLMNAEWAGGLLAWLMHAGINPKILHWGITPESEYNDCRLFVYQDNELANPKMVDFFATRAAAGDHVMLFLSNGVYNNIRTRGPATCSALAKQSFDMTGERCVVGKGSVTHIWNPVYELLNTDIYQDLLDVPARRIFLEGLLQQSGVSPQIRIAEGADRVVAFARVGETKNKFWVTVKNGRATDFKGHVQMLRLNPDTRYLVRRTLEATERIYTGRQLIDSGFEANMLPYGSDAFYIEAM